MPVPEAAKEKLLAWIQQERSQGKTHAWLNHEGITALHALAATPSSDSSNQTAPQTSAPQKPTEPLNLRAAVEAHENPQPKPQPPASKRLPREPNPSEVSETAARHAGLTVTPTGNTPDEQITSLKEQASTWEPARSLPGLRDTMVFSIGNPTARVMLVGEAPGYVEEQEVEPFVGPAGQKLNDILKAMGLSRPETYISNICKFRPRIGDQENQGTENRKPTPEEMASCMPFIRAEIKIVQPEVIIALGGTAAEGLLDRPVAVGRTRGRFHDFESIPLMVTYHPSYLLRTSALGERRKLWEDMLMVMEKLDLPISEKQRGFFLTKPR